MKKRYLIDKEKCKCNMQEFFDNAAKAMGVNVTEKTQYDCRKICISKRVQDCIWEHYSKRKGYREDEIAALFLQYGPKANLKSDEYCFEAEEEFVVNKNDDILKKRLEKLYEELGALLNDAPDGNDCTEKENDMYGDMENLSISISYVLQGHK